MTTKTKKTRTYFISAELTISVGTDVVASSKREAREIAMQRGIMSLCYQCAGGDSMREWCTSGELDGEPRIVHVDEARS